MIVPRRRPTRFDRHMNDYLKKLSILPSDVGRRDGVVFAVARGGAGAGVDFVGWVERLANIWGGAFSGWRSICPMAVALAVTFVAKRIVLAASAD